MTNTTDTKDNTNNRDKNRADIIKERFDVGKGILISGWIISNLIAILVIGAAVYMEVFLEGATKQLWGLASLFTGFIANQFFGFIVYMLRGSLFPYSEPESVKDLDDERG